MSNMQKRERVEASLGFHFFILLFNSHHRSSKPIFLERSILITAITIFALQFINEWLSEVLHPLCRE